jgi:hypothetical protein
LCANNQPRRAVNADNEQRKKQNSEENQESIITLNGDFSDCSIEKHISEQAHKKIFYNEKPNGYAQKIEILNETEIARIRLKKNEIGV